MAANAADGLQSQTVAMSHPAELCVLPGDTWCQILRFVLRSPCRAPLSAVSLNFRDFVESPLSWCGAVACINPGDCDEESLQRNPAPKCLERCSAAFINMKDGVGGRRRQAAARCFTLLAEHCQEAEVLSVQHWLFLERAGLPVLSSPASFPRLRHVELSCCDQISSYAAVIPIFQAHPELLSFRATFAPRAAAEADFASAAPRSLVALGFVSLGSPEVLAVLLARCPGLEHLWLAAAGLALPAEAAANVLTASARRLRTLSLPSSTDDAATAAAAKACPALELLCRLRVGRLGLAADDFEVLPGAGGVVHRRRGSTMALASNGALWAPYSLSNAELFATDI